MRAHNERLVLSLVRAHGALAKSDIARISGLSAQTVSVIMRALEQDGLLLRGDPVRGKIGQPSVPMSLAPDGAFFLGLKVGRRSTDLILMDFLGRVTASRRQTYPYPTPDPVVAFVAEALPALVATLPEAARTRIGGLGIAMPFQMWNWAQFVGAPQAEMDAWRDRDLQAEIAALADMPVYVQNDATAACGAELVLGTGERAQDFLYFYLAHFIGGGLVLNGQLYTGRTGNGAAIGSMPVPGPDGAERQLISVASLATLERYVAEAGSDSRMMWERPDGWDIPVPVLDRWTDEAARGIAHAILSASAVIELEAVLIDGWMPPALRADLVTRTAAQLAALDLAGIDAPVIREGTVGHEARTLGAASIPLSQRYLIDPNALLMHA
ncbi:ROK family transcriptional regulator [Aliigemmobacter aestuarii]|uniref:ROK family transcriptional regulator n=1 Tax=Aliigemmobacter aestuarii TaxID=1445661 RepID=A0A4S3MUK6_9RHOB|nr:ROK family transcriptional regulator [Gemmobacter aestuarii]THD85863.1 ROK family transcriptional regulator [Gemmobacter aestuarii]